MDRYGKTSVPVTASWSGEESFFLMPCAYFTGSTGMLAICQDERPGDGKPLFSKPHAQRQRRAIALGLCDLCGKPLKTSTKVSLSHARPQPHGAEGWAILQVEPMLHKACAAISLRHCPSLRRDIGQGTLMVRQVTRWRAQCAIMSPEYVETITGRREKAFGHGKVELLNWIDRSDGWLRI